MVRLLSKWNGHFMLYVIITTNVLAQNEFLVQISQFERCFREDNR